VQASPLDLPRPAASDELDGQAPIRLYLLGGLRLEGKPGGAPSAYDARHHVRALLALVGASRRGMARDELCEFLWPQAAAAAARNRLHHTVHLARQALAGLAWDDEWLLVHQERVRFDERVWCDVHALEAAAESMALGLNAATLHAVLPLCRGVWVPELDIGPAGDALRLRICAHQAALLREAMARNRSQGDTPAQRELLRQLLDLNVTDEVAHRELMQLDLAAGRSHAVLRSYEEVSRELTQQLGLRPSAETVALASAAAARLGVDAPKSDAWLAAPLLVGRELLLQQLTTQLVAGPGLWNLTGLSGVGKTALARELARRAAALLGEGSCFVRLGDLMPHDSAIEHCLRALDLAPPAAGDGLALLGDVLRRRPVVLVLDDLDVASDAQRLLEQLCLIAKSAKNGVRVIVSSRAAVGPGAVQAVPVPPLPTPEPEQPLGEASQCASFVLFRLRCPVASPAHDADSWRADAMRLLRRLDGLPLAIELAAARTATMTPGEILARIDLNLRPLNDGPLDLDGRHRSLQASLDWSVQLLGGHTRRVYAAVSVFPGGFQAKDVESLLPVLGLVAVGADESLAELIGAGLLSREPGREGMRMLHLPRAHARLEAVQLGLWEPLLSARLEQVAGRLQDNRLEFESPLFTQRLQAVMALEEDAVALLSHARQTDPPRFVALAVALCESWSLRGIHAPILRWAEPAMLCAHTLGLVDEELFFRFCLTKLLSSMDSNARAESFSRTMLPLIEQTQDRVLRARALTTRAAMLELSGQYAAAVELLRDALGDPLGDQQQPGFWSIYARLGMLRASPPEVSVDVEALRGCLAGSPVWPILLRGVLADATLQLGWPRRLALSDELVASARALHSPLLERVGITSRMTAQLGLDDVGAAIASGEAAQALMRKAGWLHHAVDSLLDLAGLHWRNAALDAADRCLNEAVSLLGQGEHDALAVGIPLHRCMVFALRGDTRAASASLLSVPRDRLLQLSDEELVLWSEAATVLARAQGLEALAGELATTLRLVFTIEEMLPLIKRFRDQHLPALAPRVASDTMIAPTAPSRDTLCSMLRELYERLT
jgi:DNA-binding SARP family transcriptional activator